jgi:cytochrome c oxidase assembly factor CtaG
MILARAGTTPVLNWDWEPSILIGLALLVGGYTLAVGPLRRRYKWGAPVPASRQVAFYLGMFTVLIALVSPLDALADEYLFSAHMVQHMLLTFVAPPLWLIGTPSWLAEKLIPGPARGIMAGVTHPAAAFIIFNGTMWAWHLPRVYDLALEYEGLHIIEHQAFMASAVIGWWPVLGAFQPNRNVLTSPVRVFYLVLSIFPCTALAALITLAPTRLYTFYANAPQQWGLSPMTDQQLGGALMWIPGDMIFVLAIIIAFYRWLNEPSSTLVDMPGQTAKIQ